MTAYEWMLAVAFLAYMLAGVQFGALLQDSGWLDRHFVRRTEPPTKRFGVGERAGFRKKVRAAEDQIEEAVQEAEIKMEEAAGLRGRGEKKIADNLNTKWEW